MSDNATLDAIVSALTGAGAADPNPPLHRFSGVVTAVAGDGTCTIQISGSSTGVSGIKYIGNNPAVSDHVWLTETQGVYVCMGSEGPVPAPAAPGAWTGWSPTVTASSGTLTTTSIGFSAYLHTLRGVFWRTNIAISNNGTGAGSIVFTLPPFAAYQPTMMGSGQETSTLKALQVTCDGTNGVVLFYDGTYPGANGNSLRLNGFYEATS